MKPFRLLPLIVLAAWAVPAAAQTPDLPFESGSTGADGPLQFPAFPGGSSGSAMAYDAARQETILYTGRDTWAFKQSAWRRLSPAASPGTRFYAAMTYDSVRREIVLFGGHDAAGNLAPNDTWIWDGSNWSVRTPATKPAGRYRSSMAFDAARGVAVMFSGAVNPTLTETWEWDGANWKQMFPATLPPPVWEFGSITYDAERQEILVAATSGLTVELWAYKGAAWSQKTPATKPTVPPGGPGHRQTSRSLGYDAANRQVVLLGGAYANDSWPQFNDPIEDFWIWDGNNWTQPTLPEKPPGRWWGQMVFDDSLQRLVVFGGLIRDRWAGDTWLWDGTRWQFHSGDRWTIDMAGKPDGIWHYTTIDVPAGISVRFKRNTANSPVRWLATGTVRIDGLIDLNGETTTDFGNPPLRGDVTLKGGPGGFDGGGGGVRFSASGSFDGRPGQGPAGGAPGLGDNAQSGNGEGFGNPFLQPLLGGSGGGGSGSSPTADGVPGSGGGGAILIASSRDILLNGTIRANGGYIERCCGNRGGAGAGGSILLRADRISGTGRLQAVRNLQSNGTPGSEFAPNGHIRLEAYFRDLPPANILGTAAQSQPSPNGELNLGAGDLQITSVAGVGVRQPPTGDPHHPDVIFSADGPAEIAVQAPGAADGTKVRVRLTHANGIILSGTAATIAGSATVSLVSVPKGSGSLLAFTEP